VALLGDYSIVDAGPAIWPLRAVKSPLEIERLRKACHINSTAFERTLGSIYDGMLEMEIHQKLCIEMYTQGAEETLLNGVRSGPERYSQGNSPPGYRPVAPGEMIIMDGGPVYRGYYSDIIRQAIIGPPTSRQSDLYNVAVDTCYTGLDLIREGAIPEEISRTVDSFAERSRFSAHYRSAGWCGHSLGLTVHEPPMIEVGNRRPLQAGNVLAIEPDFLEEGVGVFGIEQNVLVKEDGYELLSPVDHGLWVI
jgi:Xaa-Pro aminopeptidase